MSLFVLYKNKVKKYLIFSFIVFIFDLTFKNDTKMKTLNFKKLAIEIIATIVVGTFFTLAVIHVIQLTNSGAINWNN